jgi:hypothetical protein
MLLVIQPLRRLDGVNDHVLNVEKDFNLKDLCNRDL